MDTTDSISCNPWFRFHVCMISSRCKFGQLGPGKGQFNSPHGFCLGMDEDIIVADTNNHRIQVFEKTGEFKYQFGIPGELRRIVTLRHGSSIIVSHLARSDTPNIT